MKLLYEPQGMQGLDMLKFGQDFMALVGAPPPLVFSDVEDITSAEEDDLTQEEEVLIISPMHQAVEQVA